MTDTTPTDSGPLTTCPACEGWGQIQDTKASTIPCAVCKGEGQVEMRVDDAPPVVFGVLLAVVVVIIGWAVIMLSEALEAAP